MLRHLGKLGVRGAVAVSLTLLVVGTVVLAKLVGGKSEPDPYVASTFSPPTVTATVTATEDDGIALPTATSYPDEALLRARAKDFVTAWLSQNLSPAAWHARVAKLSTTKLSQSLNGVDPTAVPATRMVGDLVVRQRTETFALVAAPVDTGTVTLTLLREDKGWLVDGVDWDRV